MPNGAARIELVIKVIYCVVTIFNQDDMIPLNNAAYGQQGVCLYLCYYFCLEGDIGNVFQTETHQGHSLSLWTGSYDKDEILRELPVR